MKIDVMQMLDALLPRRLQAQAELDAELQRRLMGEGSEELAQTYGALVRHLDSVIRELRSVARVCDQRDRLLAEARPPS